MAASVVERASDPDYNPGMNDPPRPDLPRPDPPKPDPPGPDSPQPDLPGPDPRRPDPPRPDPVGPDLPGPDPPGSDPPSLPTILRSRGARTYLPGAWADDRSAARREGEAYLIVLFFAALAVRVAIVLRPAPFFYGPGLMYDQLGLRIAAGLGFGPTAILPPLYPFYLAMLYRVYGYAHSAVLFSHALVGALAAVLAAGLVRTVGLRRRYAIVGGLLVALFPQAIAQTRLISPQLLISLLLLSGAFLWVRSRPVARVWEALAAGLVLGVAVLGRSGVVLPALFLFLSRGAFPPGGPRKFETRGGRTGAAWLRRAVAVAAMVLVVAPWIARNTRLHERVVWVDSTWALRLEAATVPGARSVEYQVPGRATRAPDNTPLTDNRLAIGEIVGFATTRPAEVFRIWGVRLRSFFGFSGWNDSATLERFPYTGVWYRLAQAIFFGALLTLAAAWVVLLRARGGPERILGWTLVGVIGLAVVAGGVGDGRLLALPLLAVVAMRGAWGLLALSRARVTRSRPAPASSESTVSADPGLENALPEGIVPAGVLRWLLWGLLTLLIWAHGIWGILPSS